MEIVKVENVGFHNYSFAEFMVIFKERLLKGEKTFVVTANPELVMLAKKDERYFQVLNQADFVTPDGIGIVIASKILKQPLKEGFLDMI